jgi:hypothetical protein
MGNYVIAGVGNYVIVNPSNLGNYVIADTDTEEVTGSIPVSPTSTKRGSDQPKRGSEFFCINPCVATFFWSNGALRDG